MDYKVSQGLQSVTAQLQALEKTDITSPGVLHASKIFALDFLKPKSIFSSSDSYFNPSFAKEKILINLFSI